MAGAAGGGAGGGGAEHDTDLVAAAQALMSLMDKAGARAGKYTVDTRGAYGVQVGDHNRQDNVLQGAARRLRAEDERRRRP